MGTGPRYGQTWAYDTESALGTPSSTYKNLRLNDLPSYPTSTRQLIQNPNIGHLHAYNKSDKPIAIERTQEGALSFSTHIRRAAATSTATPLAALFESAGCNVVTNTGTTLTAYTSTTSFELTAADSTAVGTAGLLELNSGLYYPVLVAAYASEVITPGMAIPSASQAAKAWEVMTTIWPRSRQVVSTKTLSFRHQCRAEHTSGEDLTYDLTGCALASMDDMAIKPFEPPVLGFKFHVGKIDQAANSIDAESFVDSEKFAIPNDDFYFEFASASAAGGIARADQKLLEASVTWGFETGLIPSEGSGTHAGIQGYMHRSLVPRVKLTELFSKDRWTELEGTLTSRYIGLVQGTTSLATPAFGFWMPNAYLDPENPPEVDFSTDDYVKATSTYIATSAGYASATGNASAGAAPWFFAISGEAT